MGMRSDAQIWVGSVQELGMEFKAIPAGTFTMGSPEDEKGREKGETQFNVRITKPFELGVYPVTQEQYERVIGKNPSEFKNSQNPVENVTWYDAVEFCKRLSESIEAKSGGYVYRLPTEAEWEYACRAGTDTAYSFGDSDAQLKEYAWYRKNSRRKTHRVGQKKPNPWGLYDMHGNVWEWCQDCRGKYPSGSVTDPTGGPTGNESRRLRISRGGGWSGSSETCRSARRDWDGPARRGIISGIFGFRVLRSFVK